MDKSDVLLPLTYVTLTLLKRVVRTALDIYVFVTGNISVYKLCILLLSIKRKALTECVNKISLFVCLFV